MLILSKQEQNKKPQVDRKWVELMTDRNIWVWNLDYTGNTGVVVMLMMLLVWCEGAMTSPGPDAIGGQPD